jgi:adenosine deaminase
MTAGPRLVARLGRLPKIDLHVHLEGTLRPRTVAELARRYAPESPLCTETWSETYWTFRDLPGFVRELGAVVRTCLRSPETYHRAAVEAFEDLAADNVAYAEVSVSAPARDGSRSVTLPEILAAIGEARRNVQARTPLRVGVIVAMSRHRVPSGEAGATLTREWARAAADACERDLGVVGIDVHGDEQSFPSPAAFISAFRLAAEAGLGRRAHAGEGAGASAVWDCIRRLGIQRLAHGVRAMDDPALLEELVKCRIALDVCPTSNVRLGIVPALGEHPLRALLRANVAVTVGSDDPGVFGVGLTQELAGLHEALGFSFEELRDLTLSAAAHAFLPARERAALIGTIHAAWTADGERPSSASRS